MLDTHTLPDGSDGVRCLLQRPHHMPDISACAVWQVRGVRDIGPDYAVTLRAWRDAWEEKKEAVLQLGYTERFWRKYRCDIGRMVNM